jgi:hypothetical protein
MFVKKELQEEREAYAREQWRLAKRSLKRTALVLIVIGAIFTGFLWYLYFTMPTTISLTPAEQQALQQRASDQ